MHKSFLGYLGSIMVSIWGLITLNQAALVAGIISSICVASYYLIAGYFKWKNKGK